MTDERPEDLAQPPMPPEAPMEQPPATMEPAPAPPSSGGRLRPILILGASAVVLGAILFAVRNNQSADELAIGQCFDVPASTSVSTVERRTCTEAHDAEVFSVVEYSGSETSYPITLAFDRFVGDTCSPVFDAYVGTAPELEFGYFYPSSDGWSGGDRTITCYAVRGDGAKLTKSVKAGSS